MRHLAKETKTVWFFIALAVVQFISCVSTGVALLAWMQDKTEWAAYVAFVLSGLTQLLLWLFYRAASDRRFDTLTRLLCLFCGVTLTLISGGLSATAFGIFLAEADIEDALSRANFEAVGAPLYESSHALSRLNQALGALSERSDTLEALEIKSGASCENLPHTPGDGPRQLLRVAVAEKARDHASRLDTLATSMAAMATLPTGTIDQEILTRRFLQAGAMLNDPLLGGLEEWLDAKARQFRQGLGAANCVDQRFAEEVDAVSTLLERTSDISLPTAPPELATVEFAQLVPLVLKELAAIVLPSIVSNKQLFKHLSLPFAIATAVELIILMLLLILFLAGRGEMEKYLPFHLVQRYRVDLRGKSIIFVPQQADSRPRDRDDLLCFVACMHLKKFHADFIDLSREEFSEYKTVMRHRGVSDGNLYATYQLNRRSRRAIRRHYQRSYRDERHYQGAGQGGKP